jgi:hypothetical protein
MNNSSENRAVDDVEIHAPGVDIDEIMRTIRHNLQHRQTAGLHQAVDFPEFEEATCPEAPPNGKYNPLLYFLLRELNQTYAPRFRVELEIKPSRLDKLPLVGFLWNSLRSQLHGLSIFYARRVAGQMIGYNRYLVTVLNLMVRYDQKRDLELAELKQRLAKLETQLAQVEQEG